MSTTMVSNHVQALEERLGARLLNRTTRRVGLTEVGRAYYERCTRILEELEEADQAAGLLQTTVRGTLRLFVGAHIVPFVTPVVVEFLARHPEASVHLDSGERNIDMIEERLRPRHPRRAADELEPDRAQARRVASHPGCCTPSYIEKHGAPQRLDDLRQHNCLRFSLYPFGDEWQFIGPDESQMSVEVSGNLVTNNAPDPARRRARRTRRSCMAPTFIALPGSRRRSWWCHCCPTTAPITFAINASYPTRHHLSTEGARLPRPGGRALRAATAPSINPD